MADQLFWQMMEEQNQEEEGSKDLRTLIKESPINWEEILLNAELMQSMRTKDSELFSFFSQPSVVESFLEFLLKSNSGKAGKIGMELFAFSESPLLKTLITSVRISENLIKTIPKTMYLNIGRISRIFSLGLTTNLEAVTKLFTNSLIVVPILLSRIYCRGIYELMLQFINSQQMENKWLVWSFLKLLIVTIQTPSIFNDSVDAINNIYKNLIPIKIELKHKISIMLLLYEFIKANQGNMEINTIISSIIHQLLIISNEPEYQSIVLKIASIVPSNDKLAIQCIEIIKQPNPITPATVEAFNYLADHPVKGLVTNFEIIAKNAISDPMNTFHQIAFVKIVRSGMHPPLLRSKIIEIMVPIIINMACNDKWRSQVTSVGFLLDIAIIIDEYITDPTEEWKLFRSAELSKWRSKGDVEILPEQSIAQNNPNFKIESIDSPQTIASKQNDFTIKQDDQPIVFEPNFPNIENSEENKETSISSAEASQSSFPVFGNGDIEFPKFNETEINFPKYEQHDENENQFPKFDENNEGFPKFEENKEEFPKFGESNEEFPKFGEGEFPKFEADDCKVEFPKFDENTEEDFPKFEQADSEFPSFADDTSFPKFGDAEESPKFGATDDFPKFGEDSEFPKFAKEDDFPKFDNDSEFPKFGEGMEFPKDDLEFPKIDETNENPEFPKFGEQQVEFPVFDNETRFSEDNDFSKPTFDTSIVENNDKVDNSISEEEEIKKETKIEESGNNRPNVTVLYEKFMECLHDECWEDQAPSAAKLFTQEDPFANPSDAFSFLIR